MAVQAGAAGILATLTRAAHHGLDVATATIADIAGWISSRLTTQPRVLPGLYFGRAGTAWALLDAAIHLNDPQLRTRAVEALLDLPTQCPNPDQCHGISGAGTALLHAWQVTGDAELLPGPWPVPSRSPPPPTSTQTTSPGPSRPPSTAHCGGAHYGYGHGLAGIATFLLAVGRAANDTTWLTLAEQAGRTLRRAAHLDNGAAYFPIDRRRDEPGRLTHWCSGSSGIGTFLIRLWHHNEDPEILQALRSRRSRRLARPLGCRDISLSRSGRRRRVSAGHGRLHHPGTVPPLGHRSRLRPRRPCRGDDGLFVPPERTARPARRLRHRRRRRRRVLPTPAPRRRPPLGAWTNGAQHRRPAYRRREVTT
ncbi:lanthionine synthetase LanC family protein [Micromonospora sp. BRA006-A]|nr:lanthionine synthetase LanC family protein [Micromonospora sp. BRA006-A]